MRTCVKLILLVFSCLLFVAADKLKSDWTLHARFNTALNGHVFCELVKPEDVDNLPRDIPGGFVTARVVYVRGQYVGSVDKYGYFEPPGLNALPDSEYDKYVGRNMVMNVFMIHLLLIGGAVAAIVLGAIILQQQFPSLRDIGGSREHP